MTHRETQHRHQFSISTLLILTACVGAIAGMYRFLAPLAPEFLTEASFFLFILWSAAMTGVMVFAIWGWWDIDRSIDYDHGRRINRRHLLITLGWYSPVWIHWVLTCWIFWKQPMDSDVPQILAIANAHMIPIGLTCIWHLVRDRGLDLIFPIIVTRYLAVAAGILPGIMALVGLFR